MGIMSVDRICTEGARVLQMVQERVGDLDWSEVFALPDGQAGRLIKKHHRVLFLDLDVEIGFAYEHSSAARVTISGSNGDNAHILALIADPKKLQQVDPHAVCGAWEARDR